MNNNTIIINIPSNKPRQYGIFACSKQGDIRIRCSPAEKTFIDNTALSLGMTLSSFMRECAMLVSVAIRENENGNGLSTGRSD